MRVHVGRNRGRLFVAASLLLFPLVAFAMDPPSTGLSSELQDVIRMVFRGVSDLVGENPPFLSHGKKLLWIITGILISWKSIKILLDSQPVNQIIAEIIGVILLYGIASFMLEPKVQKEFVNGFDEVAMTAAKATGNMENLSSPETAVITSLGRTLSVSATLFMGADNKIDKEKEEKKKEFENMNVAGQTVAGFEMMTSKKFWSEWWDSLSFGQAIGRALLFIPNILLKVVIAALVVAAGLIYSMQVIMSQIMINIGLIFAPLLVPWIMWQATAFLFNGWFKFMIVSGITKVVGALLFGLTAGMLEHVTTLSEKAAAEPLTSYFYYIASAIVVAIMGMLMSQTVSIANGLVQGMPHASFRPPVPMQPGRMAGSAARNSVRAGSAVASGARQLGGKINAHFGRGGGAGSAGGGGGANPAKPPPALPGKGGS